jgi:hypothetical protein
MTVAAGGGYEEFCRYAYLQKTPSIVEGVWLRTGTQLAPIETAHQHEADGPLTFSKMKSCYAAAFSALRSSRSW